MAEIMYKATGHELPVLHYPPFAHVLIGRLPKKK